jgi:hypothetical protein
LELGNDIGMISLEHAKRSDRLMKATSSLTVAEFEALARRLALAWSEQCAAQTAEGRPRHRQPGGGRKGVLSTIEQKLFFILLYFKAYPTQDVMGVLFGITQGQVSDWVKRLTAAVGQLMELHKPARKGRQLRELLEQQPELREVIIDGTERRLPRPAHAGRQRCYYSGRKKRHAVKNIIVVGEKKVLFCSKTVPARHHDKKVAEQSGVKLPPDVTVLGDSGFAGLEVGAASLVTPWKRRKGRHLHKKRREFNRLLGRQRVGVEHALASVKRLRILRDEFRNRRVGMVDAVNEIGCAMHNFRCECRGQSLAA